MIKRLLAALLLLSSIALAQMGPPPPDRMGPGDGRHGGGPGRMGKWWKNADVVQKLGLSDDQVQRIEQTFQEHRLRLIDVKASLEKVEIGLEPMIGSDNPDENAVMKQIDKVAAQRAELEKANAHMLFAIRRVLTAEQWKKLQTIQPQGPARMSIPGPPPRGGQRERGGPGPGGVPPPSENMSPPNPEE